jgi:hypothetical protein
MPHTIRHLLAALAGIGLLTGAGCLLPAQAPYQGDDDTFGGDDDDSQPGDDDDSQADDDDDTTPTDDDDDDTTPTDDDDTTPTDDDDDDSQFSYVHSQDLAGGISENTCEGCEFAFEVNYITTQQTGSCVVCWDLDDGVHNMGFDAEYYITGYGTYPAVVYYYPGNGWQFWYFAAEGEGGHNVTFWYDTEDQGVTFSQYGYWDIGGGNMTGAVTTTEG